VLARPIAGNEEITEDLPRTKLEAFQYTHDRSPSLKLSANGLFDGVKFEITPIFVGLP
jgi:hypothetical protein